GALEAVRKQVGNRSGEAGVAAFNLGADGVEVHEPRLEERPRHRLQRLVHLQVQLDLVVQRAEDVGDGALFCDWWKRNWQRRQDSHRKKLRRSSLGILAQAASEGMQNIKKKSDVYRIGLLWCNDVGSLVCIELSGIPIKVEHAVCIVPS